MVERIPEISEKQIEPEATLVCRKPCCQPKTILLVILGLVIVAGAVYAGIQISRKQIQQKVVAEPVLAPTTIPQETEVSSSPDEIASWKIYTSEKNKYSFEYPQGWFVTKKQLHVGGESLDVAIKSNFGDQFVILVQGEGFGMSPDEGTVINDTPVEIDGLKGVKNVSENLITVRVKKQDAWYLVSYQFEKQGESDKSAVFDQILSTFKFTDQEETKYTCPQNGWENCMPILSEEGKLACSKEAEAWYKANCPNFKGLAR